jgi:hypothetical protein
MAWTRSRGSGKAAVSRARERAAGRRPHRLQGPAGDQRRQGRGEPAQGRGGGEHDQADPEHPPPAEPVPERAGGQQQAGEHQDVGVQDQGQPRHRGPSSRWMLGRATFTTVLSSITMNSPKQQAPRVSSWTLRSVRRWGTPPLSGEPPRPHPGCRRGCYGSARGRPPGATRPAGAAVPHPPRGHRHRPRPPPSASRSAAAPSPGSSTTSAATAGWRCSARPPGREHRPRRLRPAPLLPAALRRQPGLGGPAPRPPGRRLGRGRRAGRRQLPLVAPRRLAGWSVSPPAELHCRGASPSRGFWLRSG